MSKRTLFKVHFNNGMVRQWSHELLESWLSNSWAMTFLVTRIERI